MTNRIKLFLLSFLIANASLAQTAEICDNGIDDDGDGFVDCYDSDCSGDGYCDDFFLSEDPECQVEPDPSPTFAMKLQWASPEATAAANGQIAIGDTDGDGIPEVVATNYYENTVHVLDGATGNIKFQRDLGGFSPYFEVMIADVDEDGLSEIFMPGYDGGWKIESYSHDLTTLNWSQNVSIRPGNIGIANFDYDGGIAKRPVLYGKDILIDALTGTILHASAYNNTNSSADYADKNLVAGSTAADILADGECANCSGLELINGGKIYSVNISGASATLNLERSVATGPVYISAWNQNRGGTSIVDFNEDGFLDVLFNGRTNGSSLTKVFFWDVENNVLNEYHDAVDNWDKGTGRLNIADIDGDGTLNTTYVSGPYLYALDQNWNLIWKSSIIESTSGTTGATVFDFNGDNQYETVYRDENFLYIVNGNDGSFYSSQACRSLTFMEYPVVADVDADGATEICITCITSNTGNIWDDSGEGQVRVFESADEEWVPARRVWNQHGYFIVNINDDLTLPYEQQLHNAIFPPSTGPCKFGPYIPRPLNTFLNQAPYVSYTGCKVFADTNIGMDTITVSAAPVCPNGDFTIDVSLLNLGSRGVITSIPITFYNGDPTADPVSAVRLNTEIINVDMNPSIIENDPNDPNDNDTIRYAYNNITVSGPGTAFDLYAVINDNGLTPLPLVLKDARTISECEYEDNMVYIPIVPDPFELSAVKVKDDEGCIGGPTSNGEARAFVNENGSEVTAGYTFNWFNSAIPGGTPDFVGPIYSNLPAGDYSVVAVHNANQCGSDTAVVTIASMAPAGFDIDIALTNEFTNCRNPNGKLTVTVNGGDPVGNYEYYWFEADNANDTISVSHVASGLQNLTYIVHVYDKATPGCPPETAAESVTAPLAKEFIDATVTNIINCNTLNDGFITAGVIDENGDPITSGHKFNWYNGNSVKATIDFEDNSAPGGVSVYDNLVAGEYTLEVYNNNTGCTIVETFTVSAPTPITTVNATATPNTACDITMFNGTATVLDVDGETDFTLFNIEWFLGQTTDPIDKIAGTDDLTSLSNLAPGIYTIQVTNIATNCIASTEVSVVDTPPTIVATASTIPQTNCAPADGELTGVASGGAAPYDFLWYDGNIATPDLSVPDFTATSATDGAQSTPITGRAAGDYTLVVRDANGCTTAPQTVTIANNTVPFTIDNVTVDNSSCTATGNGSITATINGGTVGYSFEILDSTPNIISGSNTATNLAGGTYTIIATDIDATDGNLGCTSTASVVIDNVPETRTVTATGTDNEFCNTFNGTATASVDVNGTPTIAGFTYFWFKDLGGAAPDFNNPFATTVDNPALTGLEPGVYTVYAQSASTNCTMLPASITVGDNTTVPTAVVTKTDQTSCDASNLLGSITVEVTSPAAGYQIEIFTGANTIIGNRIINDSPASTPTTYSGLDVGTYRVRITDANNECFITEDITIVDARTTVVASATVVDNITACNALTAGSATANVGGNTTDFTFFWFNGQIGTAPMDLTTANFTGVTYSNLVAGDYTVFARDNVTNCVSAAEFVEVLDNTVVPALTIASTTSQTACSATLQNGTIELSLGGGEVFGDYDVVVFEGQSTITAVSPAPAFDPNFGGNPSQGQFTGMGAGTYTIQVSNSATGCFETIEATITSNVNSPTIAAVPTNSTACPGNGSITVSVSDGTVGEYTFTWYTGPIVDAGNIIGGETGSVINDLEPGIYTVEGVFNTLGCDAIPPVTVEVLEDAGKEIILTKNVSSTPTQCDTNNGAMEVTASSGLNGGAGFTFEWHQGYHPVDGDNPIGSTPIGIDGSGISGVTSGMYSIFVTDLGTGCTETTYQFLNFGEELQEVRANPITANTNCTGTGNGEVRFELETFDIVNVPLSWYKIDVYDDQGNLVFTEDPMPDGPAPGTPGLSTIYEIGNLTSGTFDYIITEVNPTLNGCQAGFGSFEILDATVLPTVLSASVDESTNCAGGLGNGRIELNIDYALAFVLSDFLFTWTDANGDPVAPAATAGLNIVDNLSSGMYFVEFHHFSTGCGTTHQIEVFSEPTQLQLIDFTSQDITNCDPPNGYFEVIELSDSQGNAYDEDADFDYAWFRWDGTTATNLGLPNQRTANNLAANAAGEEYYVEITHTARNCSLIKGFTIEENTTLPVISAVTTDNSNCDTDPDGDGFHIGTGSAQANVNAGGTGSGDTDPTHYTFTWFEDAGLTTPLGTNFGTIGGTNNSLASNLPTGTVTVVVRDVFDAGLDANGNAIGPDFGCETITTFNIEETPPLITLVVVPTDDVNCSAPFTGSVTVTSVLENGVAVDISQYEFTWTDDNGTDYSANVTPAITGLEGGINYMVAAIKISDGIQPGGIGCISSTFTTEVPKTVSNPLIAIVDQANNTNCGGPAGNGSITVSIDGAALDLTEHTTEWFVEGNAVAIATDVDNITQLSEGNYRIVVSDINAPNNGCIAEATISILDNPPVYTMTPIVTPNEDCTPLNGSVTITSIEVGGTSDTNLGNYTFNYYLENGSLLAGDAGPSLAGPGTGLAGGLYSVEAIQDKLPIGAIDPNTYCTTGRINFEIEETSTEPIVVGTTTDNTFCTGIAPNGSVIITIDGNPIDLAAHSTEWFEVGNPVAIANDVDRIENIDAGTYRVIVTDISTPNLGCATIAEYSIDDRPGVIGIGNIAITPNTLCGNVNILDGNGTAEITEVFINGVSTDLSEFTFTWFSSLSPNTVIPGSGNAATLGVTLSGRTAPYYVTATHNTSNCSSTPAVQFVMTDDIVEPVVLLQDFSNPQTCIGTTGGTLEVAVTNNDPNFTQQYTWYDASNNVLPTDPFNPFRISGPSIVAGFYTFEAINLTTGCVTRATYELVDQVGNPLLYVSSTPISSCAVDDGRLTADVSGSDANYAYSWFLLPNEVTPISTDKSVFDVGPGTYKVLATNMDDPSCDVLEGTTEVVYDQAFPLVTVIPDQLVTNCDVTRPNGQLSASVNGQTAGYDFEWFIGDTPTGTPFKIGPVADLLSANVTYTVLVTNRISLCTSTVSTIMGEGTVPASTPKIEVVAQQISCTDEKTGSLIATVDGKSFGYEFFWYVGSDGQGTPLNPTSNAVLTGLDVGIYSVVVTDLKTGCISEPVAAEILDQTIIPEFDFVVTPATCDQANGSISVSAAPGFSILRAEWEINGTIYTGFNVGELEAGLYTVTVYGPGECSSTAEIEVPAEIKIYNGFSPNGDGRNEWFLIECLEFFPANNVKVYNRAGQLVYTADGYNNENVRFEGAGNRGIYAGQNNVPDGTYFYIVDKNDGSPVFKGYLEISR